MSHQPYLMGERRTEEGVQANVEKDMEKLESQALLEGI